MQLQSSIQYKEPLTCSVMPKPELLWTIYTSTELACANAEGARCSSNANLSFGASAQAQKYLVPCRAKAARKAREAGQSEKRRKMREDLEKRESTWQAARNDEHKARNKLKVPCYSKIGVCACRGRPHYPI